jgi:hypothetical protein
VNCVAALVKLVPFGVVTMTSTVPRPGGAIAVIEVAEPTVKVAGAVPKLTVVAEPSPVPVICVPL